ncbi:substrate-binding domain-containing protein [Mesorhizobium sp. 1M-11]|uniref:substrate-binding domain-containing protein n=1 Tax=Mesorhizobium sp. 1M-11 TaxID=1529006 RepID=UPI0009ECBA3D|nr:substrate-binding domain-containing protein [Mesorhizobium sp. 1M-11]
MAGIQCRSTLEREAHLHQSKHQQVTGIYAAQDRVAGYREALTEAGIAYDGGLVVDGNWTPTSGYEATKRLLALENPLTAIFCRNDKMAMGCFIAARKAGLSFPRDLSVVGYDDDELSRHLRPQPTTMELQHREMRAWSIAQLAKRADRKPKRLHKVKCTLLERASIAQWTDHF